MTFHVYRILAAVGLLSAGVGAGLGLIRAGAVEAGPPAARTLGAEASLAGGTTSNAGQSDIVYNPDRNEYVVVWTEQVVYSTVPTPTAKSELFAVRLGPDGQALDVPRQITSLELVGEPGVTLGAYWPDIVYNPNARSYFVAWTREDRITQLEIYATFLSPTLEVQAVTGSIDWQGNGVPLSAGGQSFELADALLDLRGLAVTHNPLRNEYFVTWAVAAGPLTNSGPPATRVYGVRVGVSGGDNIPARVVLLSDDTFLGQAQYFAGSPDVDFDPLNNRYLTVWSTTLDAAINTRVGSTILGRWVDATTGFPSGVPFVISPAQPGQPTTYVASQPQVIYDRIRNDFVVAWVGVVPRPPSFDQLTGALWARRVALGGTLSPLEAVDQGLSTACSGYRPVWLWDERQDILALGWWVRSIAPAICPYASRVVIREVWSLGRRVTPAPLVVNTQVNHWPVQADPGPRIAFNTQSAAPEALLTWTGQDSVLVQGGGIFYPRIYTRRIALDGLQRLSLPYIAREPGFMPGTSEIEPNNSTADASANGLLRPNTRYTGQPNDARDFFAFELRNAQTITITLDGLRPPINGIRPSQLVILRPDGAFSQLTTQSGLQTIPLALSAGRHFLYIDTNTSLLSGAAQYALTVAYAP